MNNTYSNISIISSILLFILFVAYYIIYKPDYIKDENKNETNSRLIIIYSLLFSSSLSLLIVFVFMIYKNIL